MENCVNYVRVSTDQQDYSRQIEDLKDYAKRNDYNIIESFEDKLSGFKSELDRPGLLALKQYVIDNNIKYVLCWELSRLARKSSVLFNLFDFFEENKINIYFYKEGIWLLDFVTYKRTGYAIVLLSVMSGISEMEVQTMKERFKSSVINKSRNGYKIQNKLPIGYTVVSKEDKKVIINESEAQVIRDIYNKYVNDNLSMHSITREFVLNSHPNKLLHSKKNIAYILDNDIYTGHSVKNYERNFPAIIDIETYKAAQDRKVINKTLKRPSVHTPILPDVAKCSCCGGKMYAKYNKYSLYACASDVKEYRLFGATHCTGGAIELNDFESIVWNDLKGRLLVSMNSNTLNNFFETDETKTVNLKNQIQVLEKEINKENEKLRKINVMFMNNSITETEFTADVKKCNNVIRKNQNQISVLNNQITSISANSKKGKNINSMLHRINSITDNPTKKTIVNESISNVDFKNFGSKYRKIINITYKDGSTSTILYSLKKSVTILKTDIQFIQFNPDYTLTVQKELFLNQLTENKFIKYIKETDTTLITDFIVFMNYYMNKDFTTDQQ